MEQGKFQVLCTVAIWPYIVISSHRPGAGSKVQNFVQLIWLVRTQSQAHENSQSTSAVVAQQVRHAASSVITMEDYYRAMMVNCELLRTSGKVPRQLHQH